MRKCCNFVNIIMKTGLGFCENGINLQFWGEEKSDS